VVPGAVHAQSCTAAAHTAQQKTRLSWPCACICGGVCTRNAALHDVCGCCMINRCHLHE
jgi:hypothetical protein